VQFLPPEHCLSANVPAAYAVKLHSRRIFLSLFLFKSFSFFDFDFADYPVNPPSQRVLVLTDDAAAFIITLVH